MFARSLYYIFVCLLCPAFILIQLTIVYPNMVVMIEAGIAKQLMHICLIIFCFINGVGNMIFSTMTKACMKNTETYGTAYCEYCQMFRPANSWHCTKCNVCVRKRDHHCFFFARCIGLYNQRYYILFFGYMMMTMLYASYYNYYFIATKFEDAWILLRLIRIINPLLIFVTSEPMGIVDLYVYYLFMNLAGIMYSGYLFFYHLRNAVRGVTAYESKFPELWNYSEWRQNLLNVFGSRWYLAIVWPLAKSPLPNENASKMGHLDVSLRKIIGNSHSN